MPLIAPLTGTLFALKHGKAWRFAAVGLPEMNHYPNDGLRIQITDTPLWFVKTLSLILMQRRLCNGDK